MSTIVPPPTPTQDDEPLACREYLGRAKGGECGATPAGWMDERPFCLKHLVERREFRDGGL